MVFTAGCGETAPTPDAGAGVPERVRKAPADAPPLLGRAGDVTLTLQDMRVAVAEARALQHWRTRTPPPIGALKESGLLRRIAIQHMESRVVREEVARRNLEVPKAAVDALLADAIAGRPPGPSDRDLARGAHLPEDVDAALAARFGLDPARVRAVATDLVYAHTFTLALLDGTDEATLEARWRAETTKLSIEVVRVPRVPTTVEINEALVKRASELPSWYAEHPRLFRTPARRRVRALVVPDEAEARRLHGEVASGKPLQAVAVAWGKTPEALEGGTVQAITRKRMPEAFELEEGALSPVKQHRKGWMFFVVEAIYPETVRTLDDDRVRREVAAAILRERDDLPHARRIADRVAQRLKENASLELLEPLKKAERLRFKTPDPFPLTLGTRVPGLGLAPEVAEALQSGVARGLKAGAVLGPFRVRQDYVVIRIVSVDAPTEGAWAEAKADFTARWRRRMAPQMIDEWLDETLKAKKLFVDQEALGKLSLEELGVEEGATETNQRGNPERPTPRGDRDAGR